MLSSFSYSPAEIKKIEQIQFGILSPENIVRISTKQNQIPLLLQVVAVIFVFHHAAARTICVETNNKKKNSSKGRIALPKKKNINNFYIMQTSLKLQNFKPWWYTI